MDVVFLEQIFVQKFAYKFSPQLTQQTYNPTWCSQSHTHDTYSDNFKSTTTWRHLSVFKWQATLRQQTHTEYHTETENLQSKTTLKGQCHEFFCFWFFYESVSPQPPSIPLGPFRIFSKSRGDIRSSRLTTGVADTGGKWKKIFNQKNFNNLVGTPLDSRVNIYINFCLQIHFKVSSAWY